MLRAYLRLSGLVASASLALAVHRIAVRREGPSEIRARARLRSWCRQAWRWLGLSVAMRGDVPAQPCVYVANHRTYLDILVLAGLLDATFLSRGDVSTWALVGRAARDTGVVFVDRGDAHARALAARRVARLLGVGSLIVFPEGTTTGEPLPARFEGGLFRMLHRAGVPIVPVTLRYSRREVYWVDDSTPGAHLLANVLTGPLRVEVSLGDAVRPEAHGHARGLRDAVHHAVSEPIQAMGECPADASG